MGDLCEKKRVEKGHRKSHGRRSFFLANEENG